MSSNMGEVEKSLFDEQRKTLTRLSKSYFQRKISRSLYLRQRRVLLAFSEGKLDQLPPFCYNQFSQHHRPLVGTGNEQQKMEKKGVKDSNFSPVSDPPPEGFSSGDSLPLNHEEDSLIQRLDLGSQPLSSLQFSESTDKETSIFVSLMCSLLLGVLVGIGLIFFLA